MNNRKIYIVYIVVLVLSFINGSVFSQTVKAQVDRDRIFIGEQIKMKLSVEGAGLGIRWFHFPDSLNHLEVTGRSKIDTVVKGATTSFYQTISITSFDSGRWEFPPLTIVGIAQATNSVSIDVLPVDVSNLKDYNDIKDIESVPAENNWTIIAIIAAITLISAFLVYYFLVKKKSAVSRPAAVGNLSPLEWALAEINKLKAGGTNTPAEVKKFYSDLANISRTFFNMQLQQHSMQQTTDEWMLALQPLTVDNGVKTTFFQFLRLADTVKFAKYLPPVVESEISIEAVRNMLQKVSLLHSSLYSKYQPK